MGSRESDKLTRPGRSNPAPDYQATARYRQVKLPYLVEPDTKYIQAPQLRIAHRQGIPEAIYVTDQYANNRTEQSHEATRVGA